MPSIVDSFEYDIFISYRLNDNRSGWVTEFVKNLRDELATVIKDPITVYFDSNLYDGLLETHDVDKSLEGKLRSVVFIPILSQIYCDPKSFAWQNEFCAFNSASKSHEIGRDVTLRNGNVASRILPVTIHQLDPEDLDLIEKEIKTKLRPIDFTFRAPGINRPLHKQDKRSDNVNNLSYHDQLNKLANAVKEIIVSINNPGSGSSASPELLTSKDTTTDESAKSLAVIPFQNISRDPSEEYFADGITENIVSQLASLPEFRVISRTSVMRYKNTTKSAPEIANELGINFIVAGSVQHSKDKVRISIQLINGLRDQHLWSKVFTEKMDDIFELQNKVAEEVAHELKTSLASKQNTKAAEPPTKNIKAYDLFLKGRHAFNQWGVEGYRTATSYFKEAVEIDPDFHEAYSFLASSYSARMSWNGDLSAIEALPQIELYLDKAWKLEPSDNDYVTKAFVEFFIRRNFVGAEQFFQKAIVLNPSNADALFSFSYLLNMMGRFDEAAEWIEKAKAIDPLSVAYFNYKTVNLHLLGKNAEALDTLKEGLRLFPSVVRFYDFQARIYLTMERWEDAKEAVENGFRISTFRPPSMVAHLASAYSRLNENEKCGGLINELISRSKNNERGINIYLVHYFETVRDFSSALYWYRKAIESNDVGLIWWNIDPLLKNVRAYIDENKNRIGVPDFESAEKYINTVLEEKMPRFPYHNIDHVKDVVESSVVIAKQEKISNEEIRLLHVAALLHDIGFIHGAKNHEVTGAEMAQKILPMYGFALEQIEVVCNLILATRLPQSPNTHLEKILCDADLDYLGRDDFFEIGQRLYKEMVEANAVESEREWNLVQRTFLQSHKYHTEFAKKNREPLKQQHLQKINSLLEKK